MLNLGDAVEIDQLVVSVETAKAIVDVPSPQKGTICRIFGTLAGRYADPVVIPPCVAIIGTGKIRKEPVVIDDEIVPQTILPISLSFDHRAITGGEAARFLQAFITDLERQI